MTTGGFGDPVDPLGTYLSYNPTNPLTSVSPSWDWWGSRVDIWSEPVSLGIHQGT